MKGPDTLYCLRAIVSTLIAVALALVPISSAYAAERLIVSMDAVATASPESDGDMSDCVKAMQAKAAVNGQDCPCCDSDPSKASCHDGGACLAKCSTHVIAILTPVAASRLIVARHGRPAAAENPPDWSVAPTAPPPRA